MESLELPVSEALYNIQPIRGVKERKFLSCQPNGEIVDLWNVDDDSGRQKWEFIKLSEDDNVYNIKVFAGVDNDNKYLSCTPEGKVDLWNEDDKSGRQEWRLTPVGNGSFNIEVSKGTQVGKTYLSCTSNGETVNLWNEDDKSGRQQWQLISEDIAIEEIQFSHNVTNLDHPDFVVEQEVNNRSDVEDTMKIEFTKKAMEKSNFQQENGFTFAIEEEEKVEIPEFGSASTKTSLSTTNKWTYGKEESKEDSRTYEYDANIPANSKIVVKAVVKMRKMDVPYTVTGKSKITGEKITCRGIWTGVQAGEIKYEKKQTSL